MRAVSPDEPLKDVEEGEPPVFATWGPVYAVVIGFLAVLIVLFYVFTEAYRFPQ